MKDRINNIHGTVFPPALVYAGYIFLAFGVLTVTSNWILGSILICASIFISFSFCGLEIDLKTKRYKEFSIYFGIKAGKWTSLDQILYVTILHNKEIYEIHSRANITTSDSENFFEVYMLDKSHREKILVKRFKNPDLAINYSNKISSILNIELTKYNPVVSTSTRFKRYKK